MPTNETMRRLSTSLRDVVDEIRSEHQRLASVAALGPSAALSEASARRDRIVAELGRLVADAMLQGHDVTFSPSADRESVGQAEEETNATTTRVLTRRSAAPSTQRRPEAALLAEFIAELHDTEELETMAQFETRYESLRYAASHPNRWADLPSRAQRHLIGATVALLRDLQEANDEFDRPLREPEIVGLVSRLSHWSKEHRPGWVNGMARGAAPDDGAWLSDAQTHLDALREMVEEYGGTNPSPPPAETQRAVSASGDETEPSESEETPSSPMDRACPSCGASPGDPCTAESGRKLYSFQHKERR